MEYQTVMIGYSSQWEVFNFFAKVIKSDFN